MQNEIFLKEPLPDGTVLTVVQCKGGHYFRALERSKCDPNKLIRELFVELVRIDGNPITYEQADEMSIDNVIRVSEIISAMLTPIK